MAQNNILVIESDQNLGRSFHLLFNRAGHRASIAVNREEVIHCLQQGKFRTILVNQQSLDHELIEFLSLLPILTKDPIQIIFLISDHQTIPQLPPNDHIRVAYLSAPVTPEELLEKISSIQLNGKLEIP
jgi:DNA-binding response OmpR family regulator